MKEFIASFIDQRTKWKFSVTISDLTNLLNQFMKVTPINLRIYQVSIKDFKPAVQNEIIRLVPILILFVTRTLYFWIPSFGLALKFNRSRSWIVGSDPFLEESTNPQGRLMALLILEMGLLPSEIRQGRMIFSWLFMSFEGKMAKTGFKSSRVSTEELQLFLDGTYLLIIKENHTREWDSDN